VGPFGVQIIIIHQGKVGMCLYVFEFPFVWDKVCELFDGILVNIFHEGFDG
jgi:hypothetical protein